MPELRTVRGMRDLLPAEARCLRLIESKTRSVAELYDFEEVITPVVESHELLAAKAGDEVRSRMFVFKDLGDRKVALRPEFTASVARLMATTLRNQPKPFRLFSVGSVYRYDEPQRGRYREFWQSNFELFGSSRPEADAEIILLTRSLLEGVKIQNYQFKLGHVGILRGILDQERVKEKGQNEVMQLLDHQDYKEALGTLRKLGCSDRCVEVIRELVTLKGAGVSEIINNVQNCVEGYEKAADAVRNFRAVVELVIESNCRDRVLIDAGFARGLEYYTGMIFEVTVPELGVALGGGGRYDRLIELYGGEPTPAVGVAHGLDRIMLLIQDRNVSIIERRKKGLVVAVKEELKTEALKISEAMRNAGLVVELEVMGRRTSKALEDANRRNFDYAVIVGDRELKDDAVVVRDLKSRNQRIIRIDQISSFVESMEEL